MELSEKLFGYVLCNKEKKMFLALKQYNLEYYPEKSGAESLKEIISGDELLQHSFKEAVLVYNYPFSNLIPAKYFTPSVIKPVMQLAFGDTFKGLIFSEKIPGREFYNIYRIPYDIHLLAQQKFGGGKYWHFYSLFVNSTNNTNDKNGNILNLVFYSDKFIAMLSKDERLQLIQSYQYQTSEDVAYHLLTICREFEMKQEEIFLIISGLIDEQSALYMELLKYFNEVHWDHVPEEVNTSQLQQEFPIHYFLPFLKMALCV